MQQYFIGRKEALIETPYQNEDKVFAGQRLAADTSLTDARYAHCTFANIGFKDVELENCHFSDCTFISCYFRRTDISGTAFVGCKFIDCQFPQVSIVACDFRYATFTSCYIDFTRIEHSLPSEPNLRQGLADNLAREADHHGAGKDARRFRLMAIKAREQNFRNGVKQSTPYYQDKFPPPVGWLKALAGYTSSRLNSLLWGHGERGWILVRNYLILVLLIFPLMYVAMRSGLHNPLGPVTLSDAWWVSIQNVLPIREISPVDLRSTPIKVVGVIQSLLGILFAGLFVTLLFRWIIRR